MYNLKKFKKQITEKRWKYDYVSKKRKKIRFFPAVQDYK